MRKGLKPPGRAFLAGLTISLFHCVTQLAATHKASIALLGKYFVLGSASIFPMTKPIAGDAEYRAKLAKCVRAAHA